MSYQLPRWSWKIFYVELSLTLVATSRTENVLAPVSESRPKALNKSSVSVHVERCRGFRSNDRGLKT